MARTSSLSEKPISDKPRKLADWLNPTDEVKVHSLIDKVYKLKNLELAWEKVKRNIAGEKSRQFFKKLRYKISSRFCYYLATVQSRTTMTMT